MFKTRFMYSEPQFNVRFNAIMDNDDNIDVVSITHTEALPRITVCSRWNSDSGELLFGVSVCNPKDQFRRSIGKRKAYDRSFVEPCLILNDITRESLPEVSKDAMRDIIKNYRKYVSRRH